MFRLSFKSRSGTFSIVVRPHTACNHDLNYAFQLCYKMLPEFPRCVNLKKLRITDRITASPHHCITASLHHRITASFSDIIGQFIRSVSGRLDHKLSQRWPLGQGSTSSGILQDVESACRLVTVETCRFVCSAISCEVTRQTKNFLLSPLC